MTVFEHLGRLLIVDCGVLFPGHDEPGVDLILPDLRLVEDRLDDVEALVLTHAHEDHIGAIPFLLKLRPDIPLVGSKFTLALVAEKCREHRHQAGLRRGRGGAADDARCVRVPVLPRQPLDSRLPCDRHTHRRGHSAAHRRHQARPVAARRQADRPARHVAARRRRRRPVALRLDEFGDPRCRPVGERSRSCAAPADPRRRRPGHRRVLRLQRRSRATDHRRRGGPRAAGCLSSADRWFATWASPASWAICASTRTTLSTSVPPR